MLAFTRPFTSKPNSHGYLILRSYPNFKICKNSTHTKNMFTVCYRLLKYWHDTTFKLQNDDLWLLLSTHVRTYLQKWQISETIQRNDLQQLSLEVEGTCFKITECHAVWCHHLIVCRLTNRWCGNRCISSHIRHVTEVFQTTPQILLQHLGFWIFRKFNIRRKFSRIL